ncbi:MAG: 3-deoxy-7-phosphoheptulonate synthase [Thermaerobacter sp.]|nr:3-deoxy-7-phosphoheptulonate synthase [Thermaerobacter sp.]
MAGELLVTQDAGATREVAVGFSVRFGGGQPVVIAGPCSVESESQIIEAAIAVRAAGAQMLRGGAFKPRTSPYSFQGLGAEGLRMLAKARAETGLPVVTEVLDPADLPLVAQYADMLQIGARNMQNFALLRRAGRAGRPVLLKRSPGATLDEWLHAAEYVLAEGNNDVVLCERGIRSFEPYTRYTLDLGSALAAKRRTHLPVIADPSHGSGRRELVPALSRAALGAGLDGLLIEVHPRPDAAVSDAAQTASTAEFAALMRSLLIAPQTDDLQLLRGAIDAIDGELLDLIARRMALSGKIGAVKRREDMEVHEPERETAIVGRLSAAAGDALSAEGVRRIWDAILGVSRACQAGEDSA